MQAPVFMPTVRAFPILLPLTLGLLLPGAGHCQGKEPAGEPLPEEALFRLGSGRFAIPRARALAFSANGKRLLAWGDASARLFATDTGIPLQEFPVSRYAALSPDGKLVAAYDSSSETRSLGLYDTATGRRLRDIDAPWGQVAFSPDSATVFVASFYGRPSAWDVATGKKHWESKEVLRGPERYGSNYQRRLELSQDGKFLAGYHFLESGLWNLSTGKREAKWDFPLDNLCLAIFNDSLAIQLDGEEVELVTLPEKKRVHKWKAPRFPDEVAGSRTGYEWPRRVTTAAFSRDGALVAFAGRSSVTIADVKSGRIQHVIGPTHSFKYMLAFSPDGSKLAAADGQGMIRLWDVASGKSLNGPLEGNIRGVAVGRDGTIIATAAKDDTLRLWNGLTGKLQQTIKGGGKNLALSPDGALLAASTPLDDGKLSVWDLRTGKQIHALDHELNAAAFPVFGPKNRLHVALHGHSGVGRGREYNLETWELDSGKCVRRSKDLRQADWQQVAAFSANGRFAAYVAPVRTQVVVMDCEAQKELALLGRGAAEDPAVVALAFSPDGATLATLDDKGVVTVFHVASANVIQKSDRLANFNGRGVLAFTHDGAFVLTFLGETTGEWSSRVLVRLLEVCSGQPAWEREWRHGMPTGATCLAGKGFLAHQDEPFLLAWSHAPAPVKAPLEEHWQRLASPDSAEAYASMCALVESPEETLRMCASRLTPAQGLSDSCFEQLLADLASPEYLVRENATEELRRFGPLVADRLRRALLKESLPLETRRRLERLHTEVRSRRQELRGLRALTVLGWLNDPGAREVVQPLAEGEAEAYLTQAARALLHRIP